MLFISVVLTIFFIYVYMNLETKKEIDLSFFYDDEYEDKLPTF